MAKTRPSTFRPVANFREPRGLRADLYVVPGLAGCKERTPLTELEALQMVAVVFSAARADLIKT